MDPLAIMAHLSNRAVTSQAHSALPDAPVVPIVDRTPLHVRARAAAAGALHRLGDLVAPPRRQTVCLEGQ
jgi:hypothetical protein